LFTFYSSFFSKKRKREDEPTVGEEKKKKKVVVVESEEDLKEKEETRKEDPKVDPKVDPKEVDPKVETKVEIKGDKSSFNFQYEQFTLEEIKLHQGERGIHYLYFAKTMKKISETSSRILKTEILTNFFRSIILISKDDLLPCIYLCINQVREDNRLIPLSLVGTIL
jgi:DNA ligase 1